MAEFLTVDGGGSKLVAIWFQDDMTVLGRGTGGGINRNTTSVEIIQAHIDACLRMVFGDRNDLYLESLYITFIGDISLFTNALSAYAHVKSIFIIRELSAGLLAGALWDEGFLALAGTGSNLFLHPGRYATPEMEGLRLKVGGWGAIMGDDGSGVWMGKQAMQAALASYEGWGQPTTLTGRIAKFWDLQDMNDLKQLIYRDAAPFRRLASLTYLLGEAAREGDIVSLAIIREAGERMALQAGALYRRCGALPDELNKLVCIGSAWKVHPLMYRAFSERLSVEAPLLRIQTPRFEPVASGCILALEAGGLTRQEAATLIEERISDLRYIWPEG